MLSGEELRCIAVSTVRLQAPKGSQVMVETIGVDKELMGFDFIIGMSGVTALGGVQVNSQGIARLSIDDAVACAGAHTDLHIDEKDFVVSYNATSLIWTTAWKWSSDKVPGAIWNKEEEYSPSADARAQYEQELKLWIENGWLVPYDEKNFGPAKALIPLMAATQRSKGKVRSVMDFRQVNEYIDAFTANSDVCAEKLRQWRRQCTNVSIVDLRKAYL
ncbi:hypothetical protein M514_08867 [Trichuris suis]|uniref:Uncharacterized protein n=1 Tax=Trichuris suis TaxID=68888 RepID=A0A085NBR3_9BILA|nr:hypothetical protein M513_08867 [Trichuris suis]KFD66909.1 hypothetical protein M514_08867 [Trichuris suis]KHJ39990.1 hypothetical protein D918_09980 [Trichuris suis]